MSYRRYRKKGEVPEEIYVVTDGNNFRTYTDLKTARSVKTQANNHKWEGAPENYIMKCEIGWWDRVE